MKKIVVIPDSFKGSLSSIEQCEIAKRTIRAVYPDCAVCALPVADGGEGTVDCFLHAVGGERVLATVSGPFFAPVQARYGRRADTAFIEMAAAAGLPLAGASKNPESATTYGVGELIRDAVARGAREIILGLGGSCTNDGGCGCACALGAVFTDRAGRPFVPTGGTLAQIAGIDLSGVRRTLCGVRLTAMCDVDNPLCGPRGAAAVFGPQKGADAQMVERLDQGLRALAALLEAETGRAVVDLPGAGAAGGLGAGVAAMLGGTLKPGIETVLDTVDFDRQAADADLVLTGEGRIDAQSLGGKVVVGVARRAKRLGVPVVALVGDVADDAYGAYDEGVTALFSTNRLAVPFELARPRSAQDYARTLEDILRLLRGMGV